MDEKRPWEKYQGLSAIESGPPAYTQTMFAGSLANHILSTTTADGNNSVFSPLLMRVVLSIVAHGSIGKTRTQFLAFLKLESLQKVIELPSWTVNLLFADGGPLGGPQLFFADGLWVDQSITLKPAFQEVVERVHKAACNHVDFGNKVDELSEEVNLWAEKETNGLIKDLVPPAGWANSGTRDTTGVFLANALYFKGGWAKKFDESLTKDHDFFLSDGTKVQVPFMTSTDKQYIKCYHYRGYSALRLPYEQGDDHDRRFSMYIYLPEDIDGLPDLVERLGSEKTFIWNHKYDLEDSMKVGNFRIPKFKINYGFEASEVLKGHGLDLPFSPGRLTEVAEDGKRLSISNFFHKACIEVDEQGAEACESEDDEDCDEQGTEASESVDDEDCDEQGTEASESEDEDCNESQGTEASESEEEDFDDYEWKVDFVADHPFLFVVREDASGGVILVGQVVNPAIAV